MKGFVKCLSLLLAVITLLCCAFAAVADGAVRYVNTGNSGKLNLRKSASSDSKLIERLSNQTAVTVLAEEGEWVKVKVGKQTGWVLAAYLTDTQEEAAAAVSAMETAEKEAAAAEAATWTREKTPMYVSTGNSGKLKLRKEPTTSSSIIEKYSNGTRVIVLARKGEWAKVSVGGTQGYMMLSCLSETKPEKVTSTEKSTTATTKATTTLSGTSMFIQSPNSGKVNVRAETSTKARVVGAYPTGTPVSMISSENGWATVVVDGKTGYVQTKFLSDECSLKSCGTVLVINDNGASYVNLRSAMTMRGTDTVLTHVKVGHTVEILLKDGNWYIVSYKGYIGYIHKSFLDL